MICPHCQSENRDNAKFCNECGLPLSGKIAEVTAAVAAEEASRPGASGPLDPASLPSIDVAGVNVDENGNAFDFGPVGDEADENDVERVDEDLAPFVPKRPDEDDPGKTVDLSGLDECLVDASYVPPAASWRSGDTMEMPRIEGHEAPKQKEYRAPDPNKKKGGKGKVVVVALLCVAVLAGAAAGVTYYLELWGGKTVPSVTGMTQADATYVLEGKGFAVRSEPEKSDEAEGLVLAMDPGAGARQEEGTEITIRVSTARVIPDVAGRQRDEAAALLKDEGFESVTFANKKSNEKEGKVLSVEPKPGEKAKATTVITVTVAVAFTVPDVKGVSYDDAVKTLEKEGYAAEAVYDYSDDVEPGTVIGMAPEAGEKLESGATVTLTVAKSRKSELEDAAWSYLKGLGVIDLGGTSYEISSVDAVTYEGDETTSFTITGAAVTELDGETVRGSSKQKSGVIVWDASNNVVSVS